MDCAKGLVTKDYWLALDELLFGAQAWALLAESQRNHVHKTSAFRLLAKGAGAVKMLLDARHQRFPSLLYASVGAEAAAIRPIQQAAAVPCVRDVFTEEHMELVSSDLSGEKSQMILQNNATVASNQINWVERGHAVLHKITHKCLHTRKPSCDTVSRDLFFTETA